MKLYAHDCCECSRTMSYALEPADLPNAMCTDCVTAFAETAYALGVNSYDQNGSAVMEKNIRQRAFNPDTHYAFRVKTNLGDWRLQRQIENHNAKRE